MPDTTPFQVGWIARVSTVDKENLARLFRDHYQANRHLWRAVLALSDAQFTQTPADGTPSIHTQIVRMVAHENLWVNYLWHGGVEFLHESHMPTRASIRAEWDALEEEMVDFIDELSPAELERRVEPVFLPPNTSLKVWEILLQIINDAVEHRAVLRQHLQRLGSGDPLSDTLFFRHCYGQAD